MGVGVGEVGGEEVGGGGNEEEEYRAPPDSHGGQGKQGVLIMCALGC